jgi:cysteine desulfurase
MKRIYLDHAATTYLDPRVKEEMEPYWIKHFGNPSAIYEEGRVVNRVLSETRKEVASIINAKPNEIIFTGGGTESDNLAILGAARAYKKYGNHIITTKVEHHAVLHAFSALEKEGFKTTYIDVDKDGIIDLKKFKAALKKETILVSVMLVNNEIGTIQPIAEISKIIRAHRKTNSLSGPLPLLHTDAIQGAAYLDLNVSKLGVDLMSLNGSKIYGPKGVGLLYIKQGIDLEPVIHGGGQEKNLRSGTENVPGIVGFVKALELVQKDREKESERLIKLRDMLIDGILEEIPDSVLNGSKEERVPHNVNVSFYGVEGESVVLYLDAKGIACSTGSACSSSSLETSHVIKALNRSYEYAHGSIRFSLGKVTTKEDIEYVLKVLPLTIKTLRDISALDKKKYVKAKIEKNKTSGCSKKG